MEDSSVLQGVDVVGRRCKAVSEAATLKRKPRADALRNRERVLDAARLVFGQDGQDPSLEAVARQAGVGIGTLYRHFPTREALYEALYRREVDQLVDLAKQVQHEADPVAALRAWLRANVQLVATKRGMATALAVTSHARSDLAAYSLRHLGAALDRLLRSAAATGAIRDDIGADELLRTLVGMCYALDRPDWQDRVLRLVDVLVDGLRRPVAQPH